MKVLVFGDTKLSAIHRPAVRAHLRRLSGLSTGLLCVPGAGAATLAHSEALEDIVRLTSRRLLLGKNETWAHFVQRLKNRNDLGFWIAFYLRGGMGRGKTAERMAYLKMRMPGRLVLLSEDGTTQASEEFSP